MGSGKGKTRRVQAVAAEEQPPVKGKIASLIPRADDYIKHEMNVLLMGLHGTGKTETIVELAKKHGLKLKYLSASTMDPDINFTGIPVPEGDNIVFKRPKDIDECEFLVIDEFNRAHPKVMNAIFELIQFHSINGERLPKLKMVWAAMNPPGMDYDVEEVDPALLDRFDAYVDITPKPSVQYMAQHMPVGVAQALVAWWRGHDSKKFEDYISPRRLVKLGILFHKTGQVRAGLPPWVNSDLRKLEQLLRDAVKTPEDEAKEKARKAKGVADQAANATVPLSYAEVKPTAGWMKKNAPRIGNHMKENPQDAVITPDIIKGMKKIGADEVGEYMPIIENVPAKDLEALYKGRQYNYRHKALQSIQREYPNLDDFKQQFPEAFKKLSAGSLLIHPKDLRHWGS